MKQSLTSIGPVASGSCAAGLPVQTGQPPMSSWQLLGIAPMQRTAEKHIFAALLPLSQTITNLGQDLQDVCCSSVLQHRETFALHLSLPNDRHLSDPKQACYLKVESKSQAGMMMYLPVCFDCFCVQTCPCKHITSLFILAFATVIVPNSLQ